MAAKHNLRKMIDIFFDDWLEVSYFYMGWIVRFVIAIHCPAQLLAEVGLQQMQLEALAMAEHRDAPSWELLAELARQSRSLNRAVRHWLTE